MKRGVVAEATPRTRCEHAAISKQCSMNNVSIMVWVCGMPSGCGRDAGLGWLEHRVITSRGPVEIKIAHYANALLVDWWVSFSDVRNMRVCYHVWKVGSFVA